MSEENQLISRNLKKKSSRNFTQIANDFMSNSSISFKAKGIFTYLWGKPDDWQVIVKDIAARGKENESAIRSAFKELKDNGFMKWERIYKKGKLTGIDYFLCDEGSFLEDNQEIEEEPKTKKKACGKLSKLKKEEPTSAEIAPIQKEIQIPDFIDAELWNSFIESRIAMRAKPTKHAIDLLIKKLIKFKEEGADPNDSLRNSIENGYKGLFKMNQNNSFQKKNSQIIDDREKLAKFYEEQQQNRNCHDRLQNF